jgi:lipopolysaccharide export system permease protein
MRIVDRYLVREIFPPFATGVLVFTFVLLMSQFLRLVEMIVNKGVGIGQALLLVSYLLPSILVMTVPMSTLLGCLAAFGRLTADNEITALKSAGQSLWRLSLPVVFFSVLAGGLTLWMITDALPRSNQAFRTLMFDIVRSRAAIGFRERVFNDEFDGLIIYVNSVPPGENPLMKGVMIHDYRGESERPPREPMTIFATEGVLLTGDADEDVVFRLKNGSIHSLSPDLERYEHINFESHDLRLTMLQGMSGDPKLPKGLREMTIPELRDKEAELRRMKLPPWPPQVEIQKKFAIPFACLIFGFLGLSLGVVFRKGDRMVAFAVCIGVIIVYYVFLVAGEPMGKQGFLPPWLSMWGANLFYGALTALLFTAVARERFQGAGGPLFTFRRRPPAGGGAP